MTTPYVLEVTEVGKKYIINHQAEIQTLRDLIGSNFKKISRLINKKNVEDINSESTATSLLTTKQPTEDFWALKDISFKIKAGERVGIMGKNGAGKSTLLKILSRITTPTTGSIISRGQVTSLLEVGTGFHPDLTGRENVFLNGSIMGMTKSEIKNKFNQIVEFSEVEKFLDTPVKHYSSGMQVRLAFSVAAHLTPDILILDEVLSVGDYHFQQKCIKRMEEISQSGCTVIFVSHNIDAIEKYCKRAILLVDGKVKLDTDNMNDALALYKQL